MPTKSKKNLIIFPGFFLPHVGGLETHVDEFVKYLSKDPNYNITIFAPNIPLTKEKETVHHDVQVIRYPAFELVKYYALPKFWSITFWKLFSNLYKTRFDFVMTRTRFFFSSFLGLFFAKIRKTRPIMIHVEHGSHFVHMKSSFTNVVVRIIDMTQGKLVFAGANKTVAISRAVKRFVCKHFVDCSNKNIALIRRGVDEDLYKKTLQSAFIKERFKGKKIITFVGRLVKWKSIDSSIRAFQRLPVEIQKKSVLLIIGDGEQREHLENTAGELLDNGIYFLGQKPFKETLSILKATDIYVHSASLGGGLSHSLLQAMLAGCTIVASPHEGAGEVILPNKTGILLSDNKPESIEKGIISCLKNPEKSEKYGAEAARHVREHFSWDLVIERYKDLFEELLKG